MMGSAVFVVFVSTIMLMVQINGSNKATGNTFTTYTKVGVPLQFDRNGKIIWPIYPTTRRTTVAPTPPILNKPKPTSKVPIVKNNTTTTVTVGKSISVMTTPIPMQIMTTIPGEITLTTLPELSTMTTASTTTERTAISSTPPFLIISMPSVITSEVPAVGENVTTPAVGKNMSTTTTTEPIQTMTAFPEGIDLTTPESTSTTEEIKESTTQMVKELMRAYNQPELETEANNVIDDFSGRRLQRISTEKPKIINVKETLLKPNSGHRHAYSYFLIGMMIANILNIL